MDDQEDGASRLEEESNTDLRWTAVGLLKAREVNLNGSAAGLAALGGNLTIHNGGCGPVLAKGDVKIRYGGCGPVIAGGDVSIEYGATQSVLAAGSATIGPRGFAGFVVSPRVMVEDGGKVLLSSRQAIAFGAAAGIAWALLSCAGGSRTRGDGARARVRLPWRRRMHDQ
jgi:hypothetical protein